MLGHVTMESRVLAPLQTIGWQTMTNAPVVGSYRASFFLVYCGDCRIDKFLDNRTAGDVPD